METDFVKFLVLVISGILGMWIYKPFVYRGGNIEHGRHDMTIALVLVLCGYLVALTVPVKLGGSVGLLASVGISCLTSVGVAALVGSVARHLVVPAYRHKGDFRGSFSSLCRYRSVFSLLLAALSFYKLG